MISNEDAIWILENGTDEEVLEIRKELLLLVSYLDAVMVSIPCGAFDDAPSWDEFEKEWRVEWHPYPQEKPPKTGVVYRTRCKGKETDQMYLGYDGFEFFVEEWADK